MTGRRLVDSADRSRLLSRGAGDITRRALLRNVAIGGGTVLVACGGGLSYRAYGEGVFETGEGSAYEAWGRWDQHHGPIALVAAAVLAANPHNTQPWVFHVSPERIELFADPARNIGAVDPYRREMYVGLGCAIENMRLAGLANGYRPRIRLLPTPDQPVHAATVELPLGHVYRSDLYRQIPHRHTDRSAFASRAVPASALSQMSALSAGLPGTRVYWFTSGADRRRIAEMMIAAAQALTRDREQSIDDNRWFRHDWDAIQRYKDGLTLDAQGLSELTTAIAKLLPATSREYNDNFWVQRTRDPQTKTAAAYGIIAVPDPGDHAHCLNGGRLLERIHLWTAAHGLSLGHMNQITERLDRERQTGAEPTFTNATRQLIPDETFQQLVAFRIGYPSGSDGRRLSPRIPASEVVR